MRLARGAVKVGVDTFSLLDEISQAYLFHASRKGVQRGLTPAIKHDINDHERQAGHAERN